MFKSHVRSFVVVLAAGLLCLGTAATAEELATATLGSAGIDFQGKTQTAGYSLTVSGPDGMVHSYSFVNGEQIYFDLASIDALDGHYNWELRPIAAPRNRADGVPVKREATLIQSGGFWVRGGAIVTGGEEAAPAKQAGPQSKMQVFTTDLIVQGSACVGFDCASSESFGSDTLRLKENNLRIHFDDTSSSASFPGNDWRLTANDSTNGGANYFRVEDATAGRSPFTIEAGAQVNTLYVEDDGDVGIKTSNPVVDLHIVEGNTPTLRLEQDGSDGFQSYTWDIAGNETNFFVRDVTGSSKLPFRIEPGSPDNSIYIDSTGDIGMGTSSPGAPLDVRGDALNQTVLSIQNAGTARLAIQDNTSGTGSTWFNSVNGTTYTVSESGTGGAEFTITNATAGNDTKFEFAVGATAIAILQADGDLNLGGVVGVLSDRNSKNNIVPVDTETVLERVRALPISTWTYEDDQGSTHMGPMAQDFYAAFGLYESETSIAVSDLSGVALAAIQGLDAKLADKESEVERLSADNEALASRLAALEAMVAAIAGEDVQN